MTHDPSETRDDEEYIRQTTNCIRARVFILPFYPSRLFFSYLPSSSLLERQSHQPSRSIHPTARQAFNGYYKLHLSSIFRYERSDGNRECRTQTHYLICYLTISFFFFPANSSPSDLLPGRMADRTVDRDHLHERIAIRRGARGINIVGLCAEHRGNGGRMTAREVASVLQTRRQLKSREFIVYGTSARN